MGCGKGLMVVSYHPVLWPAPCLPGQPLGWWMSVLLFCQLWDPVWQGVRVWVLVLPWMVRWGYVAGPNMFIVAPLMDLAYLPVRCSLHLPPWLMDGPLLYVHVVF